MRLLLALVLAVAVSANAEPASKADLQAAHKAFRQALKLQRQNRTAEAFAKFKQAADLDPGNREYVTAREVARQQLVLAHLRVGNDALLNNDRILALAEFRAAADLDPSNQFAAERLRQSVEEPVPSPSHLVQVVEQSGQVELSPDGGKQNFHFSGDTRGLLELVSRSFGLTAIFDDSFSSRPINFNADGADFVTAISLASRFAHAMWSPLAEKQILFAQDTQENHRQFDHMILRTFYLPDIGSPQEMNEVVSVLRGLFEIRYVVPNAGKSTLTVRAPKALVDAAGTWLDRMAAGRPQVMLDLRTYEVNDSLLRTVGVSLPLQFQIFNIPAAALQLTQNPNVQDLINQLIASGGLNQANTQAISALLAQLQSQAANPLLSQRFVTFGGGLTLFGLGVPPVNINFSLDKSRVSSLEHMTLRAAEGNAATFRIGTRFPVLNGTFSPATNTPAINSLLTNQTFVAPFPSFSYEDLGISLKATPQIHGSTTGAFPHSLEKSAGPEITLELDLNIRSLSSVSLNGIPVISNRQFTGAVRLREGEPAVIASMVSKSDQHSLTGIPGLGGLPLLGRALENENKNATEGEILFVITPYIVRSDEQSSATELWLPPGM